ncbi:OmpA family protein [Mesorhizobium sp.]|uniref:OmpA family protein n=1 Tax=Mesorhizobium sp. TaxID=1871066 RepID=UPI003BAD2344
MKRQPWILAGTALGLLMASAPLSAYPLQGSVAFGPSQGTTMPLLLAQSNCAEGESAEACAKKEAKPEQKQPEQKQEEQKPQKKSEQAPAEQGQQQEQPRKKRDQQQQTEQAPAQAEQPAQGEQQPRKKKRDQQQTEQAPAQAEQPAPANDNQPEAKPRKKKQDQQQPAEAAPADQAPATEPAQKPGKHKKPADATEPAATPQATPEPTKKPAPAGETAPKLEPLPVPGTEQKPAQAEQPNKAGEQPQTGEQPLDNTKKHGKKPGEQPANGEQPATGQQPANGQQPATGQKPANGEQPANNNKPAQGENPVQGEAPLLDSQKDAQRRDQGGQNAGGQGQNGQGQNGQGQGGGQGQNGKKHNNQNGQQNGDQGQKPVVAPVDQGPPPTDDKAAQQEIKPEKMVPVTQERGKRIDRAPDENIRDRQRPKGVDVLKEIGDRVILQLGGQTIVQSNDGPRMNRGAKDVYYEDLPGGRTRETVERDNGTQIVTIRNRYGDVVQRSRIMPDGREYVLSYVDERHYQDDKDWRDPGDDLPPMRLTIPRRDYILDSEDVQSPDDYYNFLEQPPVERVQRLYSVDEVKRSARVRDIARRVDLDTLNFEFGSSSISDTEVQKLQGVADAMEKLLKKNPAETFLIEGHTDAVGTPEANLALSDRRAEAVAEALTNAFGIPPENLTTQGYGEEYLKINTQAPNRENRRVAIRRITSLVAPVASNN